MKTGILMTTLILGVTTIAVLNPILSGADEHEANEASTYRAKAAQAKNTLYSTECSACHMAYPPRLLPAEAWKGIMNSLDRHFGDNAELSPEVQAQLTRYLVDNAGTVRGSATPTDNTLPRITTQPWFRHEHNELPDRLVARNPDVRSFSNCAACHTGAAKGRFSEHDIRIPGYGGWDD